VLLFAELENARDEAQVLDGCGKLADSANTVSHSAEPHRLATVLEAAREGLETENAAFPSAGRSAARDP